MKRSRVIKSEAGVNVLAPYGRYGFLLPLVLLLVAPPGAAQVAPGQADGSGYAARCELLEDLYVRDTNLLSAAIVPADGELPEFCRLLGYVRPAINFEIRLPTSNWNGKFYMAGCGGYCGSLARAVANTTPGLRRHYAVSGMDSGHWGEDLFDGRWAYHDRQAEIDYGYRAVHETARVTKAVIGAFYGRPPEWSYFDGCSNGGRQAVMEALRYPDDFDGLISEAPHPKVTGTALLGAWLARVNTGPDGQNLITPTDLEIVRQAVYAACDHVDGLEDGLISDPRDCRFDPAGLLCAEGRDAPCLTETQVEALEKMYDGPRDSTGRRLYSGLPLGSEPYWSRWVVGKTADGSDDVALRQSLQFLRYMAFRQDPGEDYTLADVDFDSDPQRLEKLAHIYNVDDPDLGAFRESGGKLLMLHSWADAGPPPMETTAYYEAVESAIGSRDRTQEFFRLFMVPGMDHCGIGEGPGIRGDGYDPLTALELWVEEGEAPASLMMTKTTSTGEVLWTRPICPYPQRAAYKGGGAANDASSFECVSP